MKSRILNITIFVLLTLVGCQTIPEKDRLIAVDPSEVSLRRGVLLTEFTGIRCVNCPLAAEEAHSLTESFDENLVIVAMHPASNSFTKPAGGCDFTCPEADVYYKSLGGTASTSFPTGCVNFAAPFTYYTDWAALIIREGVNPAQFSLSLSATRSERTISAQITSVSTAKDSYPARVLLWLVENDVVGFQMQPDGSKKSDYVHQHMLRAELLTAALPNDDAQKGWGTYLLLHGEQTTTCEATIPEAVNPQNCVLVAVLLDDETHTVLNVKQIKL